MRLITLKGSEQAIAAGEIEVNKIVASDMRGGGGGMGAMGGMGGMGMGGGGGGMGGMGGGAPRPGLGFQGGDNFEMVLVPANVIGLVIGQP